jgi:hypothetical protein
VKADAKIRINKKMLTLLLYRFFLIAIYFIPNL